MSEKAMDNILERVGLDVGTKNHSKRPFKSKPRVLIPEEEQEQEQEQEIEIEKFADLGGATAGNLLRSGWANGAR